MYFLKCMILSSLAIICIHADESTILDFLDHIGKPGTQNGRDKDDPKFYSTNSDIPSLPFITGHQSTHGTPRFNIIAEQTFLMIGDAKHGLWRTQDNGHIREYRKKSKVGLRDGVDPNSANLDQNTLNLIRDNYAHLLPDEGWSGYKYPDDSISDGSYDGLKDYSNWVDLTIYHPKYGGKYSNHVAIDLPHFYCTMSQNDYPYAYNTWKYATAQPQANKIGPLGIRAGLDIKELYTNVLRVELFPDAGVWANIGVGNSTTDGRVTNINELKNKAQTINFQRVDLAKHNYEIYLFERPFFNKPYLFITVVIDDSAQGPSGQFRYVRPHGAYWEELQKRQNVNNIITQHNYYPQVHTEVAGTSKQIHGLPLYGHHHPDRKQFKMSGGICPSRGGDWGRYPWSNSGGSWPTAYEEITPLCDGVVMDIKLHANLWIESWNDPALSLGNSAFNTQDMEYIADANMYGKYTDPYLANEVNPFLIDLTTTGKPVEISDRKPNPVTLKFRYDKLGKVMEYNPVDISKPDPECPEPKECSVDPATTVYAESESTPEPEITSSVPTYVAPEGNPEEGFKDPITQMKPTSSTVSKNTKDPDTKDPDTKDPGATRITESCDNGDIPDWEIAVIVLLVVLILLNLLAVVAFFCTKPVEGRKNGVEMREKGIHNNGMSA